MEIDLVATQTETEFTLPKSVGLLLLLVPSVIVLALCEWFAVLYLKDRFGDDFDLKVQAVGEMAPSSYQIWEHPANYWNWSKLSRYNNLGFRRFEDTDPVKAEGVTRIFFMGGSGALGSAANPMYPWYAMSGQAQYSADETISRYLETLLNEKYPDQRFEVINAATNWTQLHQQLIHYYRKVRHLQPDLVISMDGQNDALAIGEEFLSTWDHSATMKTRLLTDNFRVKMRPLITRSHLLYFVAAKAFGDTKSGRQPNDTELVERYKALGKPDDYDAKVAAYAEDNRALLDQGVNSYLGHLQHFNDALQRDGVKALFIQQPELVMDRSKSLTDIEQALQNYLFEDVHGYAENFFSEIEQGGLELHREGELPFYSFLNIFGEEQGEIYVDYTHLTPEGNMSLARTLLGVIETEHPDLFATRQ